jgi:hypothetical protein
MGGPSVLTFDLNVGRSTRRRPASYLASVDGAAAVASLFVSPRCRTESAGEREQRDAGREAAGDEHPR